MEAAGLYETIVTIAYKSTMRSKYFYTKEFNTFNSEQKFTP